MSLTLATKVRCRKSVLKELTAVSFLLPVALLCGCGGSSSNSGSSGSSPALVHYVFADLGSAGGIQPTSINNKGQIVGFIGSISNNNTRAFLHNGISAITEADELGVFPGVPAVSNGFTSAAAINNLGQVVGTAQTPIGSPQNASGAAQDAFVYDTQYHDLGGLPPNGFNFSYATGINDQGTSVGYTDFNDTGQTHPFRHSGTGSLTANDDLGLVSGFPNILPAAINNSNLVVGAAFITSVVPDTIAHAFAFDTTFHDLGTLTNGGSSYATAVNNSGEIVGYVNISGSITHAFHHTGINHLSGADDMGVPPNFSSSAALAVNTTGTIVGRLDSQNGDEHAFVCQGQNTIEDLNSPGVVTDLPSTFVLQSATGINDQGQIVGYTNIGGYGHAWLLTPTQ